MFVSIIQREIQEQTVANFYLAFEAQLTIIPVINKVDIPEIISDLPFKCSQHFIYSKQVKNAIIHSSPLDIL